MSFDPTNHPGLPAIAFLQAVQQDRVIDVWPLLTRDLRRARVQSWILATAPGWAGDDDLVEQFSADVPADLQTWGVFAGASTYRWKQMFDGVFGLIDLTWPVGPTLCIVALTSSDIRSIAGGEIEAGESLMVQHFVMGLEPDGWRIAGIGRALARPGWPPSEELLDISGE